jgi:hypothetical protein
MTPDDTTAPSATPQRVIITDVQMPFGRVLEVVFQYALAGVLVTATFGLIGGVVVVIFQALVLGK